MKKQRTFYRIVAAVDIEGNANEFVKATVKKGTVLYPYYSYNDSELNVIKTRGVTFLFGSDYKELNANEIIVEQKNES